MSDLDDIVQNSQQGVGWANPDVSELEVGDPAAGSVDITPDLPPELQSAYGLYLAQISDVAIIMRPNSTDYWYFVVGTNNNIPANLDDVFVMGWVRQGVVKEYLRVENYGPGINANMLFGHSPFADAHAIQFTYGASGRVDSHNFFGPIFFDGQIQGATVRFTSSLLALAASQVDFTLASQVDFARDVTLVDGVGIVGGVVYEEQFTAVINTSTLLTEQIVLSTANSMVLPSGRAFGLDCRVVWECAAANSPTLRIREGVLVTGTELLRQARTPLAALSTDLPGSISGIFVNTSGADVTTKLTLTVTLSAATLIRFDHAAAPVLCYIEVVDKGFASDYSDKVSVV